MFPKGVMLWSCVTANGADFWHFIDGTVNAETYKQMHTREKLIVYH